ncbi:MAG: NAD(P)H-hydrate dehydratase [Candidatus Thermoplasmatota archaeon]|jgi:NAD(P)H-hydrate epimerase|nr:NAD(P)H-hydrate dehydratase [Candidatus Thermoplasmatota archaeon]
MISEAEMKVIDTNSEYFGVPTFQLMENAGKNIAEFIQNHFKDTTKHILLLCGTGNNGGDGFVAARYLTQYYPVTVFLTGTEIKTQIAQKNYQKLQTYEVKIYHTIQDLDYLLQENDLIIDALLGTGLAGPLKEPYATIVKKVNETRKKTIISVDVPTGLGTPLAVQPDHTVTFHDKKQGMTEQNSGTITVVDIGIPQEALTYVGPGELSIYYPRPAKKSHKGDNGVVLIIGGGPYIGAPALSGLAALRTGVDLVYIATPQRSWESVAAFSPNFIVKDLTYDMLSKEDLPVIEELLRKCTGVILGPGLGAAPETEEAIILLVKRIIEEKKPLVLDADAIKPVGEHLTLIKNSTTVVTPHVGEFKKLTGITLSQDLTERMTIVKEWAQKLGITFFLKGYIDVLSNGSDIKQNKIHNEAMTVGGTGDVLAGIIGALLSKGVKPYEAVRIAAFLNGEAGNEAFQKKSYGLLATDIIEEIPNILKKYL